jgi:NitT/TauT family transport system permease protein
MMALLRSPFGACLVFVLAWAVLVPLLRVPPLILPSLPAILRDGVSVWPALAAGFLRTLLETVLGFALGAALGVGAGVAFAYARWLERAILPLFVASQTVPVIAFGAIVVIWFGNTLLEKVMIAFYLTFFPVTVNTIRGLRACDPERLALLRSFGARGWQRFGKLALPSAAPAIIIGLKLGISLSLAGAIVGEWFGATTGLGVMLLQSLYDEQTPRVWVLIIACGLLGALLNGAISLAGRRFVWWLPA